MLNRKILLVEDDPDDRELICMAMKSLEKMSCVVPIGSGEDALEYLRRDMQSGVREISFILMDINLPLMSGIDTLRDLKHDETLKTIPVVMFTSSRERKDIEECYRIGANGYVVKPARFSEYIDTIRCINSFWTEINIILS